MSRGLLFNVMLAAVWAAVTGSFSGPNLVAGFVAGYLVLLALQRLVGSGRYVRRIWLILDLAVFFVRELVVASVRIAIDVLTPSHRMQPGVIAFPLEASSSGAITLLANLISLTPGGLSLDVSEDRSTLYIHLMYIKDGDVDAERDRIKQTLERRVLQVLAPEGGHAEDEDRTKGQAP